MKDMLKIRICSLFVVILLMMSILSVMVPVAAEGENNQPHKKVSKILLSDIETLEDKETTVAVIKLKEANLKGVESGEVVAALKAHAKETQAPVLKFLDARGVRVLNTLWLSNAIVASIGSADTDIIHELATMGRVDLIFENFEVEAFEDPDGPEIVGAATWGLDRIRAPDVWGIGINGSGVRVCVLDTGVHITHPDLTGKMWTDDPSDLEYPGGWIEIDSYGNIVPNSVPHDTGGHGTHCSGIVLGGAASDISIGVAPGSWLMHGLISPGGSGSFAQVVAGMEWSIDPTDDEGNPAGEPADVVSMSWGATGYHGAMISPIENMRLAGVVPIAAIGNDGTGSTNSPGNVYKCFGIGAMDVYDNVPWWSSGEVVNWPESHPEPYIKPDFSAPGVSVYSSIPPDGYVYWSGTSMATPHVAGTVALMLQGRPATPETIDELYEVLRLTADDLGDPGQDIIYGWGVIDAYDAVAAWTHLSGVEGIIVTDVDAESIEGAEIYVSETVQATYTNETGYYKMYMAPGNYTLTTSAFGYYDETEIAEVIEDEWAVLNFVLEETQRGWIAGTVTKEAGELLDASIEVYYDTELIGSIITNESGYYSIEMPEATYTMKVSSAGYVTETREDLMVIVGEITTENFVLEEIPQIIVVISDTGTSGYPPDTTTITQNLDSAGYTDNYIVWKLSVSGNPPLDELLQYEVVMWFSGSNWNDAITLSQAETLVAYVDQGGYVWISGDDHGWDAYEDGWLGTETWYDLFHVSGWMASVDSQDVKVTIDHEITQYIGHEGTTFYASGPYLEGYTSVVGSTEVLSWTATGYYISGVAYEGILEGNGKIFYFSGVFKDTASYGIQDDDVRTNLLRGALEWLGVSIGTLDTTSPASITDLINTTHEPTYINWTWNNPPDPDFSHVMVYLDGAWKVNTSDEHYNAIELSPETSYEIGTRTVDTSGNINSTWVNDAATTAPVTTAPVTNAPPVLDAIGDKTVDEGQLLEFIINASDTDEDALTYSASNLPAGSTFDVITRTFRWTPTFEQVGTYPDVRFEVSDGFLTDSENIKINVNDINRAPVADVNGPYSGIEGVSITFNGSGSYDPDGGPLTYDWNFGDGNNGIGSIINHTYAQEGNYTVTLTVTDNKQATNTDTTTTTVTDTEPTAYFTGNPTSGPKPLTVSFTDASTSYDGIISWFWEFGDGTTSTEQNPTHDYAQESVYTVSLTVTEADGDSDIEIKVGYIIVAEPEPEPPIIITISTDKPEYALGETVTITMTANYSNDVPLEQDGIKKAELKVGKLRVKPPEFEFVEGVATYIFTPTKTGEHKTEIKIEDIWGNRGEAKMAFTVIIVPELTRATIETDRAEYGVGEKATITAKTYNQLNKLFGVEEIDAWITPPVGSNVSIDLTRVATGTYEGEYVPENDGGYTVTVEAKHQGITKTSTTTFTATIKPIPPLIITISTDKPEYALGETVTITMTANYSNDVPLEQDGIKKAELKVGKLRVKPPEFEFVEGVATYIFTPTKTGEHKTEIKIEDIWGNRGEAKMVFTVVG